MSSKLNIHRTPNRHRAPPQPITMMICILCWTQPQRTTPKWRPNRTNGWTLRIRTAPILIPPLISSTMSHRVKLWLSSIRKTHTSSSPSKSAFQGSSCASPSCSGNVVCGMSMKNTASDVLQYMLTFLDHGELHRIRLVGKEWNTLCDVAQSTLQLSTRTPAEQIKYWMLKLCNIRRVILKQNIHIDDRFLIWLKKEYLPLKLKQRQCPHKMTPLLPSHCVTLDIHFDISFCFGIDCVEEPQLYGRGGVNGHNDYLKKLMNSFSPYGCTFNIFGNFRIINPSVALSPKHVVLLQLLSLKFGEVQHCFKWASPANRQFTGPLPRFERMIRSGYPFLVHWDQCKVTLCAQSGADQWDSSGLQKQHFVVTITKGEEVKYLKWTLSRQILDPYAQCWMTDSVCSIVVQSRWCYEFLYLWVVHLILAVYDVVRWSFHD